MVSGRCAILRGGSGTGILPLRRARRIAVSDLDRTLSLVLVVGDELLLLGTLRGLQNTFHILLALLLV